MLELKSSTHQVETILLSKLHFSYTLVFYGGITGAVFVCRDQCLSMLEQRPNAVVHRPCSTTKQGGHFGPVSSSRSSSFSLSRWGPGTTLSRPLHSFRARQKGWCCIIKSHICQCRQNHHHALRIALSVNTVRAFPRDNSLVKTWITAPGYP